MGANVKGTVKRERGQQQEAGPPFFVIKPGGAARGPKPKDETKGGVADLTATTTGTAPAKHRRSRQHALRANTRRNCLKKVTVGLSPVTRRGPNRRRGPRRRTSGLLPNWLDPATTCRPDGRSSPTCGVNGETLVGPPPGGTNRTTARIERVVVTRLWRPKAGRRTCGVGESRVAFG